MNECADNMIIESDDAIIPVSVEYRNDITKEELVQLCRLCGNVSHQMMPIFTGDGAEHNLLDKIREHIPIIEIIEDEWLPSNVCYQCVSTLISWHELYYACKETDMRMKEIRDKLIDKKDGFGMTSYMDNMDDHFDDSNYITDDISIPSSVDSKHMLTDSCLNKMNNETEIKGSESSLQADVNRCGEPTVTIKTEKFNLIFELTENEFEHSIFDSVPDDEDDAPKRISKTLKMLEDESEGFKCYRCGRSFQNKVHYMAHFNEQRIICANPSIFHGLHSTMKAHPLLPPEKINPNDEYECAHCDQRFPKKKLIETHILCFHPCVEKFKCDFCPKKFITECDLAAHRIIHSLSLNLICNKCGARRRKSSMPYEMDRNRIGYEMCACKRTSSKKCDDENRAKKRRKAANSSSSAAVAKKRRKYVELGTETLCNECGRDCKTPLNLRRHLARHKTEIPCDICGKNYTKLYMEMHKLIHFEEKKYVCDVCGKGFAQFSSLRWHQMLEKNIKKFVCSVCGEQFVLSSRLHSHMKTHLETQPFKCEHCEREYGYAWQLKQHMVKHSNERPFVCKVCGRAYKTSRHLRQHMAIHDREKASRE